jgi:hypothetical protein
MHDERPQTDVPRDATAQEGEGITAEGGVAGPHRLSRREVMGRMSVVAAAGAVAWAAPEILTAKPAAGATLSGPVGLAASTSVSSDALASDGPDGVTTAVHTTPAAATANPLAFTGLNIQRDAEVGAALVAGGWAMQHWASRAPKAAGTCPPEAPGAPGG